MINLHNISSISIPVVAAILGIAMPIIIVFDAIELFSRMASEKFTTEVNYLLNHSNYDYKLVDGRMEIDRIHLKYW